MRWCLKQCAKGLIALVAGTVRLTTADQLTGFSAGEEKFLETIISEIAASGVKVLVSGGAVSEMVSRREILSCFRPHVHFLRPCITSKRRE